MAEKDEVLKSINDQLEIKKRPALNAHTLDALTDAIVAATTLSPAGVLQSLIKIFLKRSNVIDAERQKIVQEETLNLICEIHERTSKLEHISQAEVATRFNGLVEVIAKDSDTAIGLDISTNQPVVIESGTRVQVQADGVRTAIGVKIGS